LRQEWKQILQLQWPNTINTSNSLKQRLQTVGDIRNESSAGMNAFSCLIRSQNQHRAVKIAKAGADGKHCSNRFQQSLTLVTRGAYL